MLPASAFFRHSNKRQKNSNPPLAFGSRPLDRGGEKSAAVSVLEANDVVLSEVASRLHLDDLERQAAGVLEAMLGAGRNVGRFVLGEQKRLLAARDPRGAAHHDPIL